MGFSGDAAGTGAARRRRSWAATVSTELGIDVMCTNHQLEFTLPGGKKVRAMKNVTDDLIYGRVAPVEFGPTTIPLVTPSVALEYVTAMGWDTGCGRMPPMSAKARAALASYSATGPIRAGKCEEGNCRHNPRRKTTAAAAAPGLP